MDQPSEAPAAPPQLPPPRPPRRRWLGTIVALVALAALAALAWYLAHRPPEAPGGGATVAASGAGRGGSAVAGGAPGGPGGGGRAGGGGPRGAPPSTVGVATAARANLPVLLDALGTVTPAITVTVRPQVSGQISLVLYTEGQLVKKGQLLVTIDPRPFEIALQQAIGARMRDEAQLENAKVQLQRYQTLLGQDSIARQDVDTQAALAKQLEATIVMDRANESTARLNLGYSRIVAPVAGRVGLRPIDVGNYISAGDANGVAVLTQLAPIDVVFSVPQDRVPEVQAGVAAGGTLAVAAFDRTRTRKLGDGVFATLDNLVDVQTGTVKAKARFPNADNALFPNQFVNVRLLLRSIDGAVVIPVTAIRNGPNGDFVYVVGDDRTVSVRPVTRGIATTDVVAVTKGLAVGERVVTEGGDRLREGARVQLASDRPASAAYGGGRRSASGAAAASGADSAPPQRRRQRSGDGG
ncbi:MAG TPA: efflux RND transporter periplasmic adaptor subunit [Caldimonas sp.]|nr:efflux RND transporter periplasmic adaptor subunit [Caldimonas sp.]HEX4234066.1 efflux RND transporter periplasmic adaptor subunit [Caldimonas sp.]